MIVEGFSQYDIDILNFKINDLKTGEVRGFKGKSVIKLKHDSLVWKNVKVSYLKALCGVGILPVPETARIIPHTEGKYYIDTEGNVYSFNLIKTGKKLKPYTPEGKYPVVKVSYKGKNRKVEVHQLMCVTFIMEDYVEKGLVCMHLDDNKQNYKLSNLQVGTYSQNNKDAYTRGLNKGNGLKKVSDKN